MKPTSKELQHELADFYGSESFYRHGLNRNVIYTEGVQHFAERAGASWLLDILATEPDILRQGCDFAVITLKVKDDKADIIVTDGNEHTVFKRHIEFTDCPPGDWPFFFEGMTLMLPGER